MSEKTAGTIKVGWMIDEKDLLDTGDAELSPADLRKFYDRLEELLASAFHQEVRIWIDGEDKPPVEVWLEAPFMGDHGIEIDDGPVNGTLADLRGELGRGAVPEV